MSSLDRYFSSRLRRPTSSSSPRRLWWSYLCTLRCSVSSLIRRVSSATWTSGDPVSPSLVACTAMISFFTVVFSGTLIPLHVELVMGRSGGLRREPAGQEPSRSSLRAFPLSQPPEGTADGARYSSRQSG